MRRQVINLKTKNTAKFFAEKLSAKDVVPQVSRWQERLVWWLVKRLKINFIRHRWEDCFRSVPIDSQSIFDAVKLSSMEILLVYERKARYLLIGKHQAHELLGEVAAQSHFSLPIEAKFAIDGELRILGLTAVIVPWMDGFCLVPELKEKV